MRAAVLTLSLLILGGCSHLPSQNLLELHQQADAAYGAGDYAQASELYRQLADKLPTDAGIRYQLGNSQARLGDHSAAIASYRATLLREPQHARAWHNLLQVQVQETQHTAAEMQNYLNDQIPHASRALERAQQVLEAHP